jgi:hypothetical protein
MAIACGYPDTNDAARLGSNPVHKLLVGRHPIQGEDLASQPTLSRFENSRGRKQLFRVSAAVTAVLRPGNVHGSAGAIGILRRLIQRVKKAFPWARIRVRLDGGFATPEVLDFLDCEPKVEYIVNLAANAVLKRKVESAMKRARRASKVSGQTEHVYGECRYATRKTWPWKRRVIYKTEVVRAEGKEPKDNPRFVVTNLKQSPQWIYEQVYCPRGDIENRIKELHDGMQIGRTSCSNFWANTFRVILTAAAYVLMQEMRLHLATTRCPGASLDLARTFPQTGDSGCRLGAARRPAPAAIVSGSSQLCLPRPASGCLARLSSSRLTPQTDLLLTCSPLCCCQSHASVSHVIHIVPYWLGQPSSTCVPRKEISSRRRTHPRPTS